MPDKLTDSEIVKALECCTTNGASCKDCPAFVKVDRSNCKKYFRGALDLINRLQAENDRKDKIYIDLLKTSSARVDVINELQAEKEVLKARIGVYETCNARKDEANRHLEAENERLLQKLQQAQAENKNIKLEENNMSSAPWGNETERADYYVNEYNNQLAICKRLDEENESLKAEKKQVNRELSHICRLYDNLKAEKEKLKIENSSLSKEIIDTKIEMYKQCIEEMQEKIVNTPFDVDFTGKTNEYREGYLDGLVAKQHNILDILDNLLKELIGE